MNRHILTTQSMEKKVMVKAIIAFIVVGIACATGGLVLAHRSQVEESGNCVCATLRMGHLVTYNDERFACSEPLFGVPTAGYVVRRSAPAVASCAEHGNDPDAAREARLAESESEQLWDIAIEDLRTNGAK